MEVYLSENKQSKVEPEITKEQEITNPVNNLIKNLKYEVKLDNQNQYRKDMY